MDGMNSSGSNHSGATYKEYGYGLLGFRVWYADFLKRKSGILVRRIRSMVYGLLGFRVWYADFFKAEKWHSGAT